jgi:hypothetical protein
MEDNTANGFSVSNNKVSSSRSETEVIQQIAHHAYFHKDTVSIMERYL